MRTKHTRTVEEDLYNFAVDKPTAPSDVKYLQLIQMMMEDKNYSVAKEKITCYLAGVNHNPAKHDYDGSGLVDGENRVFEVKPTTYWGGTGKLSMKCSFADYTEKRLVDDIKHNPIIVVSGFNLCRLIYAVQFDFNAKPFVDKMKQCLHSFEQDYKGKRIIPAPNIRHIMQIPKDKVKVLYPPSMEVIRENKKAMQGNVFKFFEENFQNKGASRFSQSRISA